ncbi:hypothetical protein Btru_058529 [Bulinus truncatus]|nr:hypothetical protein Btru_058529 [Bulinus truncatus]
MRKELVKKEKAAKLEQERRQNAAIVLQGSIRFYQMRIELVKKEKAAKLEQERRQNAAIVLQRSIRFYLMRKELVKKEKAAKLEQERRQNAAIVLQRSVRFYLMRKELAKRNKASAVIQKYFRAYISQKKFQTLKSSVIKLQRMVKRKQQFQRDRAAFLVMKKCATVIQTAFRMWLTSRNFTRERSVIKIQTYWRMHKERVNFCQDYSAVQVLRSFMDLKQQQMEMHVQHSAAVIIQRTYRHHLQKHAAEKQSAAFIIQRTLKSFLERKKLERHLAACVIQRAFRLLMTKKRLHALRASIKIQNFFRMCLTRKYYHTLRKSVILIQTSIRVWLARRLLLKMKKRKASVICLQAAVRGWLTRKKISNALKQRLEIIRKERLQSSSATKLQALWRGYRVRRNTKNVKIVKARKKVQDATRAATKENTIGVRTTSALDFLLHVKDLAQVLEALMRLEFATHHSAECCLQIIEVNAVSVLYRLISSCNRSVPHMELIKYALCILLNLAKCEKTLDYVLMSDDNIAVLLDMLQIYRDKGPIFLNTCMLLGILGLNEERKMLIVQHPQFVERLQSIYMLIKRKQKVTKDYAKTRQAAMKSSNSSLLVTPCAKRKVKKVQPKKMIAKGIKDFDNPLVAINFLMNVLDIEEKM